ncbi:MAG: class I SAM-dependent methyltransferase [Planctomycetota bacterium]
MLEPFCGHARYGPAFASRGVAYVGFDLAEPMLANAPSGDGITVVRADARDFEISQAPPGGFDLAWCPVNSFSHLLTEPDVVAHLQCVRRHLKPDGAQVLELALVHHDGTWQDPPDRENTWSVPQFDGSTVHAEWKRLDCDLVASTCTERATFRRERNGHVISEASTLFTMRMWSGAELVRVAAQAGFDVADHVVAHQGFEPGPKVELSPALENDGLNYYFFLTPSREDR